VAGAAALVHSMAQHFFLAVQHLLALLLSIQVHALQHLHVFA
jgi:hypothetical protein